MAKHPGGRPKEAFDWHLVDSLIILEASCDYIAERLLIGEHKELSKKSIVAKMKLIQRRVKERFGCSFVQYRQQKAEHMRIKLRQLQWKNAENGSAVMQIWLGKQMLGQTDKLNTKNEHSGPNGTPIQHELTKEKFDAAYDKFDSEF